MGVVLHGAVTPVGSPFFVCEFELVVGGERLVYS